METASAAAWPSFWRTVTFFDRAKLTPWLALRNTVGVALPLAIGAGTEHLLTGLVVCTGALNVAFSDSHAPYQRRAQRMLTATALVGLAVFTGGLVGHNSAVAVAAAALWAFAAGMLVSLGPAAADVGTISLVTLVVYSARPAAPGEAALAGLLAVCGGLLQAGLSLALWTFRRYQPERRVLAELYSEMAGAVQARIVTAAAPPATAQTVQAQQVLAGLSHDHSVEAERYQMLFSQSERLRLSALALDGLRRRIDRQSGQNGHGEVLARYFDEVSTVLKVIGASLLTGVVAQRGAEALLKAQELTEGLRATRSDLADDSSRIILADALSQMDALNGQLRAAADLAFSATPEGSLEFQRREARRPWTLRLAGRLATLRANLALDSAAFRHAVRLSVCVAVGTALANFFHLARPYWVPMTIAIVLKPDFGGTFSRGVLRLAGTFAGLIVSTVMFHFLPNAVAVQILSLAALMYVLRWVGPANYGLFVAAVSAIVVLLIAMSGVSPKEVIVSRGLNTVCGGTLALAAYWLWPTWERRTISQSLAQMLDAYRTYFDAVNLCSAGGQPADERQVLESARTKARLARSNAEASAERFSVEPRTSAAETTSLAAMLASSHRFIHAVMALEAGLSANRNAGQGKLLADFGEAVSETLQYTAATLSGNAGPQAKLPDLRERQQRLLQTEDSAAERQALVIVQTDRIANSLNTLREQAEAWRQRLA